MNDNESAFKSKYHFEMAIGLSWNFVKVECRIVN